MSEADMKLNIGMWGENDLLNIFKLYFTDLLVNMIVQETNRYENKHLIAVNREGVCVVRLTYMGQVSFSSCSHIYDELTFRKSKLVCTCSEINFDYIFLQWMQVSEDIIFWTPTFIFKVILTFCCKCYSQLWWDIQLSIIATNILFV